VDPPCLIVAPDETPKRIASNQHKEHVYFVHSAQPISSHKGDFPMNHPKDTNVLEARINTLERTQRRTRALLILAGGIIAGTLLAGFAQPEEQERPKPVTMAYYSDGNEMYLLFEDGTLMKAPMSNVASMRSGGTVPWQVVGK
jgi:hypothetical protein